MCRRAETRHHNTVRGIIFSSHKGKGNQLFFHPFCSFNNSWIIGLKLKWFLNTISGECICNVYSIWYMIYTIWLLLGYVTVNIQAELSFPTLMWYSYPEFYTVTESCSSSEQAPSCYFLRYTVPSVALRSPGFQPAWPLTSNYTLTSRLNRFQRASTTNSRSFSRYFILQLH